MTSPALTIAPDEPLDQAVRLMGAHHVRRLVVEWGGRYPVGILSTTDLVRAMLPPS